MANLGLWTYVLGGGKDADATAAIRKVSLAAADQIVERTRANGYRQSLTSRDYIWGSNAVAANYGMQLLVANAFERKPAYVETALDNLHYLLGRNTFSLSWVTQVGAESRSCIHITGPAERIPTRCRGPDCSRAVRIAASRTRR